MRSITCVVLLAAIVMVSAYDDKPIYDIQDAPALFEKFVEDYNKHYKDAADREAHFEAFVESLKSINELNADQDETATFDINELADYTPEEQKNLSGFKED